MATVKLIVLVGVALLTCAVALGLWLNSRDQAQAQRAWQALESGRDQNPPRYDPAMVAGLPDVARRYFAAAIAPGTPLNRTVRLTMQGSFVMNGNALPMTAEQVLAPPDGGFVWRAEIGSGLMRFAGSDGYHKGKGQADSWTKFWLMGLVPLARVGGSNDHARSAATRAAMESVWAPAALLPQFGAEWAETGPDTAEIRFPRLPDQQPLRMTLDNEGHPVEVVTMRWSDANPDKVYRLQPFGGRMLEFKTFQGFTVPVRVEIGNLYGAPGYAPFFLATITDARY